MIRTVTTYYCDRCGEKMTESPMFWCGTHPDTAIHILLDEWKHADLCDKCKESFRVWWKKKSSESPTEIESDVLDNIRSEIEEYKSRQLTMAIGVEDLEVGKQTALEYVFAILDKYKTESRDKE